VPYDVRDTSVFRATTVPAVDVIYLFGNNTNQNYVVKKIKNILNSGNVCYDSV